MPYDFHGRDYDRARLKTPQTKELVVLCFCCSSSVLLIYDLCNLCTVHLEKRIISSLLPPPSLFIFVSHLLAGSFLDNAHQGHQAVLRDGGTTSQTRSDNAVTASRYPKMNKRQWSPLVVLGTEECSGVPIVSIYVGNDGPLAGRELSQK